MLAAVRERAYLARIGFDGIVPRCRERRLSREGQFLAPPRRPRLVTTPFGLSLRHPRGGIFILLVARRWGMARRRLTTYKLRSEVGPIAGTRKAVVVDVGRSQLLLESILQAIPIAGPDFVF